MLDEDINVPKNEKEKKTDQSTDSHTQHKQMMTEWHFVQNNEEIR